MREGQKLFFHLLSKSKILHLGPKAQKAFSYIWALPHDATRAQECTSSTGIGFPLHAGFLSHWNHPRELLLQREGISPALFSVSPWQPLSPPSGCHIKERSCHLSGLTQALQLLGRSHSPSPRDWRISSCTPPFWNFGVFGFHTKKTKKMWSSYTLKNWKSRGLI